MLQELLASQPEYASLAVRDGELAALRGDPEVRGTGSGVDWRQEEVRRSCRCTGGINHLACPEKALGWHTARTWECFSESLNSEK